MVSFAVDLQREAVAGVTAWICETLRGWRMYRIGRREFERSCKCGGC